MGCALHLQQSRLVNTPGYMESIKIVNSNLQKYLSMHIDMMSCYEVSFLRIQALGAANSAGNCPVK